MSRKGKRRYFSIGKNYPPNDDRLTSYKGAPNSYLDTYRKKDGTFIKRRKYGQFGEAYVDLDTPHRHDPEDHVHVIKDGIRQPRREPSKSEKIEFQKAKRKRRFWNDKK